MKAALIDASSIILLFKADLLVYMTTAFRMCLVSRVFEEITVDDREGAAEFRAALAAGSLKQVLPAPVAVPKKLAALGAGERETLLAFEQGLADFVIMDDRKGALYCRSRRIPYINALLCASVLLAGGYLDEEAHAAAFGRLLHLGRYSRWVVDFARGCAPRDLDRFLPDLKK